MSIYGASLGQSSTTIGGGTSDSVDAARLARNARLISRSFPQFADDPQALLQLAGVNMPSEMMADQLTTLSAARIGQNDIDWMRGLSKSGQRVLWKQMTTSEQQAYSSLGYEAPTSDGQKGSDWFGADFVDSVGNVLGDAWQGMNTAIGTLSHPLLEALAEIGEVPTEMYRAIRQQPEWVQMLAGAVGVGVAGVLTAASGGVALPLLGEVGAGLAAAGGVGVTASSFAALTAAYTTAGIYATTHNNAGYWGRTFDDDWNRGGEGVFEDGALRHATQLLDDDAQINDLAQTLALSPDTEHGDISPVSRLIREFASRPSSTTDQARRQAVSEIASRYAGNDTTTPQYQQAYASLEALSTQPRFMEALTVLEQGKISPGRDFADFLHLPKDSALYSMASGAADATFLFATDPILASGKVLHAQRALRFGIKMTELGEGGGFINRIEVMAKNPSVQRAWDQIADHMSRQDPAALFRLRPGSANLYWPMEEWANAEKARLATQGLEFQWSRGTVERFFKSSANLEALLRGESVAGPANKILQIPHLTPVQSAALRARNEVRSVITHLDDANLKWKWEVPGTTNVRGFGVAYEEGLKIASAGIRKPELSFGGGLVYNAIEKIPVIRQIGESAGSFFNTMLTYVPTDGFVYVDFTSKNAFDRAQNVVGLTELGRYAGLPSDVRAAWANILLNSPSGGARHRAIQSFYKTMFDELGVSATPEGADMVKRFLNHETQAFSLGRKVGTELREQATGIVIPNARELRHAVQQQAVLNKLLNLTDVNFIDTAVNKIWKPSVLLRIGFITRAVGDEMLSWLGRGGFYDQVAGAMARQSVKDTDYVGHVHWLAGLQDYFYGKVQSGLFRTTGKSIGPLEHNLLTRYTAGVRKMYQTGLMKGLLTGESTGAAMARVWLAPERSIRSLVFTGVPQHMLKPGLDWATNPIVRASVMNEVSAIKSGTAHDIAKGADRYADDTVLRQTVDDLDPEIAQQMNFRNEFELVDPDSAKYDLHAWHGQNLSLFGVDGVLETPQVMNVATSHVDATVLSQLAEAGITTPQQLYGLAEMFQAQDPNVRRALQFLLSTDDPAMAEAALQMMLQRRGIEAFKAMLPVEELDPRIVLQYLPRIAELNPKLAALQGLRTSGFIDAALDLHAVQSPAARRWLAVWLGKTESFGPLPLKFNWTEAERALAYEDAFTDQIMNDPNKMRIWRRSEDSAKTPITGRVVARPAAPGQQYRYLPTPTVDGIAKLQALAAGDRSVIDQLINAGVDSRTVRDIAQMAEAFSEYPAHVAAVVPSQVVRPLWWGFSNPKDAESITKALNKIAGIEDDKLLSPFGQILLPSDTRNANIVKRYWDSGAYELRPESLQASSLVRPGEGLVDFNGTLVPGATEAEAFREWAKLRVQAWQEKMHSPLPGDFPPNDTVLENGVKDIVDQPDYGMGKQKFFLMHNGDSITAQDYTGDLNYLGTGDPISMTPTGLGEDFSISRDLSDIDYESDMPFLRGKSATSYDERQFSAAKQQWEMKGVADPEYVPLNPIRPEADAEEFLLLQQGKERMVIGDPALEAQYGSFDTLPEGLKRIPRARAPEQLVIAGPIDHALLDHPSMRWVDEVFVPQSVLDQDPLLELALNDRGIMPTVLVGDPAYRREAVNVLDIRSELDRDALEPYWEGSVLHLPSHAGIQLDGYERLHANQLFPDLEETEAAIKYATYRAAASRALGLPMTIDGRLVAGDEQVNMLIQHWIGGGLTPAYREASTLSQRTAMALEDMGITPDDVKLFLENGTHGSAVTIDDLEGRDLLGKENYSDFVQRYGANLAHGMTHSDAMGQALREIGYLPGQPVVGQHSRVLWETVGPQVVDYGHMRDALQGPHPWREGARAQLANPSQMRSVPREDLPRNVVRPKQMIRRDPGFFDKFVQFGFGKAIGPAIDKMIRNPMAFSNYAAAYRDASSMTKWLRDPALFAARQEAKEVNLTTAELVRPWHQGEQATIAGLATSHGATPEARRALLMSGGEPWFDAYGNPSKWLNANIRNLEEHLGAEDPLRNFLSNVRGVEQNVKIPAAIEEGSFHKIVRQVLETRTNFKISRLDRANMANYLVDNGWMPRGQNLLDWMSDARRQPVPNWLANKLASTDTGPTETALLKKLHSWMVQPPATVDLAMEDLMTSVLQTGAMPAWATTMSTTEGWAVTNKAIKADFDAMETAREHAMHRAVIDTIPFIDRDSVRSQWQEYVHNLVPFWFAEDQFLRRAARTLAVFPEAIRKGQIVYQGLKSGGVIRTDEFGHDIFVYPGSSVMAEVIGKLPFFSDKLPVASAMTGQVMYSLPGLDRFGVPQVSPLISIPMAQISSIFPEMQPVQQALAGQRGAGSGVIRSLVPSSVMRFYDAIMSDDGDRRLSSAMKTAAEVLEANGNGLPDNADAYMQEQYLDRLKNTARTILMTQAFFGFIGPASPDYMVVGKQGSPGQMGSPFDLPALIGINTPDAILSDEFIDLVQHLGAEEGTQAFLKRYPDATPHDLFNHNIAYRVGQSQSVSGAPLPPTALAEGFLDANYEWARQNKMAAGWLIPPARTPQEAASRDINTWMDQMAIGLRTRKAPKEMIQDLKFAVASETYFTTREQMQAQIDAEPSKQMQTDFKLQMQLWTTAFLATHPLFAEQLQSGEGRVRRAQTLQELRLSFQDPAAPNPWHKQNLEQMVINFDEYQQAKAALVGRRDKASIRKGKSLDVMFTNWGEDWIRAHPELKTFWLGVIKPEAGV